jgi:hypothetical protein
LIDGSVLCIVTYRPHQQQQQQQHSIAASSALEALSQKRYVIQDMCGLMFSALYHISVCNVLFIKQA